MTHLTQNLSHAARRQKLRRWRFLLWAVILALIFTGVWQVAIASSRLAADSITTNDQWRFVDESKPGSSVTQGTLESLAEEAPAEVTARFTISSPMQALALQLVDGELNGLPLDQVEELGYCTRLLDGPRPYAVTLQVNIDADLTDDDNSWQGRLVYNPSSNGAIIQDKWQCWDTLDGKWWATGGPLAEVAAADQPQPLQTLLTRFPHLGIHQSYGAITLKAGDGWNFFEGESSPVVIGVEGDRLTMAFGDAPQPATVLLPMLMYAAPPVQSPQEQPHEEEPQEEQPKAKQDGKEPKKDKDKKKNGKKEAASGDAETNLADWRAADWADLHWAGFDWQHFDWDTVDWEQIDWDVFGLGGNNHAEHVRAFVEDVKQCKNDGWQAPGFESAGACVTYYVKENTPTDVDWSGRDWQEFDWGRTRSNREEPDEPGEHPTRDQRSDDD